MAVKPHTRLILFYGTIMATGALLLDALEVQYLLKNYLGISERESDVLALLAAGHSNKEIADQLFVSSNTVKTHLHNLYQKLDVSRRGQTVQKARSLRLVP